MKKNLNALMLLGMALTLGTGSVVQARNIERGIRDVEGSSFRSSRQDRLRYERRERGSKQDYAAEAVRDQRDESFVEYREGKESREFSSDYRLGYDGRSDYVRAYGEIDERERDVSSREEFARKEHRPDKARDGHTDGHHPGHVRNASSRPERET